MSRMTDKEREIRDAAMASSLIMIWVVSTVLAVVLAFAASCSNPPPPPTFPQATEDALACAEGILQDVAIAPSVAMVFQIASQCQMTVADVYAWIANLVKASALPADAGSSQAASPHALRLQQWLDAAAQAKTQAAARGK